MPKVNEIIELADKYSELSDEDLIKHTKEFRSRLENGETLDDILVEAFATVVEASTRTTGLRPYPVQILGGIVLHQGRVAEMKTGEGKTLVAAMPSYLNALSGNSVHVITVNDYLATRDAKDIGRIHTFLGLSVGVITADTPMQLRKQVYNCDIVYGTNNEFGFDYLRDNMASQKELMVQRDLSFAIIDEVDSILIDEARTPLIISGEGNKVTDIYYRAEDVVSKMTKNVQKEIDAKNSTDNMDGDYIVDEKHKSVIITGSGYEKIEKELGVKTDDLDDPNNAELMHAVTQAMKAHGLMEKDRDYMVDKENNEILIIDEFTGRIMYGRRYNDGLHQAIEAKEHLEVKAETVTLATISFQNYFRMYNKISGMSGTAATEEEEFNLIYKLDIVEIPTNKPMIRIDHEDRVYLNGEQRDAALVKTVKACNDKGQPVLIGTDSVEHSEHYSKLLAEAGLTFNVLNAKNHKVEAAIIAQAGRRGAITIATNMAGRGTDILLGGNKESAINSRFEEIISMATKNMTIEVDPETGEQTVEPLYLTLMSLTPEMTLAYNGEDSTINKIKKLLIASIQKIEDEIGDNRQDVINAGGLFVMGTCRNESRRVDNQIRGRAGRQGDPGESCFFLALDDDLLRVFGGEKVQAIANLGGSAMDGQPLSTGMLSSIIERAQKNIEGVHFNSRKTLIQFDDVVNTQREIIYKERRQVLMGDNMHDTIMSMLDEYIDESIVDGEDIMLSIAEDNLLRFIFESDEFSQETSDSQRDNFKNVAHRMYDAKFSVMDEDQLHSIERAVLLSNVDIRWREHITAMEELRKGVSLRSYGQKDPIQEYKFEGTDMFNEMTSIIRRDTVVQLMTIPILIELNDA